MSNAESRARETQSSHKFHWIYSFVILALASLGLFWLFSLFSAKPVVTKRAISSTPSLRTWLGPDTGARALRLASVSQAFGLDRTVIVALRVPRGTHVFSKQMVALNKEMTSTIKALPGVSGVISLADSLSIQKQGETLVVKRLLPTQLNRYRGAVITRVRDQVLSDPLLRGSLVSADGRATLFICQLRDDAKVLAVAKAIHAGVVDWQARFPKIDFGLQGAPAIPAVLVPWLTKAWKVWLLGSVVLLLLLCLLAWRRIAFLFFALLCLLCATGVSAVLLSLGRGPLWTVALAPLFAGWVLLWWGLQMRQQSRRPLAAIHLTQHIWLACACAAFSGVVWGWLPWPVYGWLALVWCLSSLCAGVCGWLWMRPAQMQETVESAFAMPLRWSLLTKRRQLLQASALVGVVMSGAGWLWLPLGQGVGAYLPEGMLRQGEQIMERHLDGAMPLLLRFEGDLKHPVVLKSIQRAGARLEAIPGVSQVQSVGVIVRHLHALMNRYPRVPDTRAKINSLWLLLEGQPALKMLVRQMGRDGLLQARFAWSTRGARRRAVAAVERAVRNFPLRYQRVDWDRASTTLKARLLMERRDWIVEGIALWWRAQGGVTLSRGQRKGLRALIATSLQSIGQSQGISPLPTALWQAQLKRYLSSEDCDLELSTPMQVHVLRALLDLNRSGRSLNTASLKKAVESALADTPAAKDTEGQRYAVRSLRLIVRRIRRKQSLFALQARVLRLLRPGAGGTEQSPQDSKVRVAETTSRPTTQTANATSMPSKSKDPGLRQAALLALRAELLEVFNPEWFRTDRGKRGLRVTRANMPSLIYTLASRSRRALWWSVFGLFCLNFLLGLWKLGCVRAALRLQAGPLSVFFVVGGAWGWGGGAFGPWIATLLLGLVLLSLLPAWLVALARARSRELTTSQSWADNPEVSEALDQLWFGSAIVCVLLCPLWFTGIPPLVWSAQLGICAAVVMCLCHTVAYLSPLQP